MPKLPVTVLGVTFPSIKEAAHHFNQHYGNVTRRLRAGWTLEQALGITSRNRVQPGRGRHLVTSGGTFPSIRAAASHFGIDESVIQSRLANDWPPDEAVGLTSHKRKPKSTKTVICKGKAFPNAWALAKAYGLKEQLVAKRLRCGWTPEQAVQLEPAPPRFRDQIGGARSKHWKRVDYVDDAQYPATDVGEYKLYLITNMDNGKKYVGITITPLWQRFNGHKANVKKGVKSKLYNSMREHGCDRFEVALLRKDAKSFAELQYQEVKEIERRDTIKNGYNVSPGGSIGTPARLLVGELAFPSHAAAAEYFGIDASVFNLRISRLGWTPEQAAEIEPRTKFARQKILVAGMKFTSFQAAADHFKVDYKTAYARWKRSGWTIQQALGVTDPPATSRKAGVELMVDGKRFKSVKECALFYSVKSQSLWLRLTKYGDLPANAIKHLLKVKREGSG